MKIKLLLALFLMMSISFMPFQGTRAQGTMPHQPTFQDVIDTYALKPVSANAIPEGIVPLQFKTPNELQEFLSKVSIQAQTPVHTTYINPTTPPNAPTSLLPNAYTVITRGCAVKLGYGLAKFHTWADIRVGYSGSFHWIDSVLNTRTGLTGITTSASLSNEYSYPYNQTATSVSVRGGGIVNIYILIKGGIRLFSIPVSCSFTYKVH